MIDGCPNSYGGWPFHRGIGGFGYCVECGFVPEALR